ncbi:hypothetical protein [Telluribacter humicola]|uniref:hypothetical protein n=1 Tax=Telluribacter humicola TaxID=1720261 RepID=UPI001A95B5F0|nr:hypothetical protein [Telluribacter humicola]
MDIVVSAYLLIMNVFRSYSGHLAYRNPSIRIIALALMLMIGTLMMAEAIYCYAKVLPLHHDGLLVPWGALQHAVDNE